MSQQLMYTPGGLSEHVNEIFLLCWSLILVKSKTWPWDYSPQVPGFRWWIKGILLCLFSL